MGGTDPHEEQGEGRAVSVGDISWMDDGACREHFGELWFPKEKGQHSPEARAICLGRDAGKDGGAIPACPVLDRCAAYALARTELDGVWGGMTERDRRNARGAQRRKAA